MAGEELRLEHRPELTRPVLVASFRGWNDGAQGASKASAFLSRLWHAEQFAEIDPEQFFDFQSTRQHVSGLAKDVGVEMVVTLGSLLADVPHTRPAPVTASASDSKLMKELGVQPSRYEGPTGIVGVLHDACGAVGIPSVSLWAAVPHYVSLTPSPRAAKALCDRLATLLDVPLDTTELEEASDAYMQQVSEAVAADEDTAAYVEELEGRVDEVGEESDLPSGETLAAELTRFLRERE